jgi:hypothetical protein
MIPENLPILAKIVTGNATRGLRSEGKVERKLNDTTYEIKLPSGRITVELRSGSLALNAPVVLTQKNNQLMIQTIASAIVPADQYKESAKTFNLAEPASSRSFLALIGNITAMAPQSISDKAVSQSLTLIAKTLEANLSVLDRETVDIAEAVSREIQKNGIAQADGQPTMTPALKALLRDLEQRLICLQQTAPNMVNLATSESEGFLRFATTAEALNWLAHARQSTDDEPPAELSLPADGGPVIIRSITSDQGTPQAVILPRDSAGVEIEHFLQKELQSPLWKMISSDSLLAVLENKGSLPTERLALIDAYLMQNSQTLPSLEDRPRSEVEPLLRQWIALILESDTSAASLISRNPLNPASDIAMLYGKMAEAIAIKYGLTRMPPIENYVINDQAFGPGISRPDVVPFFAEKLGLNTEAALLRCADSPQPIPDNLKTRLYSILNEDDGAEAPDAEPIGAPVTRRISDLLTPVVAGMRVIADSSTTPADIRNAAIAVIMQSGIGPTIQQIDALGQILSDPSVSSKNSDPAQITAAFKTAADLLTQESQALPSLLMRALTNNAVSLGYIAKQCDQSIDLLQAELSRRPVDTFTSATAGLRESLGPLLDKARQILGAVPSPAADPDTAPGKAPAILRDTLSQAVDTIKTLIETTSGKITQLQAQGSRDAAVLPQIRTLLNQLVEQIQKRVAEISLQIQRLSGALPDSTRADQPAEPVTTALLKRELSTVAYDLTQTLDHAAQKIEAHAPSLIRHQAETIIQRIEALQVLAKPTNVPDGQQQLLMLPIRIGNEWSEVSIRLIKKREQGSNSKKERKDFAVQINVAPGFCGPVAVHMEYHPSRTLNVRMDCENPSTLAWFEHNRPLMSDALGKLGFPAVQITGGIVSPAGPIDAIAPAPLDKTANIDLRV